MRISTVINAFFLVFWLSGGIFVASMLLPENGLAALFVVLAALGMAFNNVFQIMGVRMIWPERETTVPESDYDPYASK